jgi:hypothetical protein
MRRNFNSLSDHSRRLSPPRRPCISRKCSMEHQFQFADEFLTGKPSMALTDPAIRSLNPNTRASPRMRTSGCRGNTFNTALRIMGFDT